MVSYLVRHDHSVKKHVDVLVAISIAITMLWLCMVGEGTLYKVTL